MKLIRFIKKLLIEAGQIAICGIAAACFMGIAWCVGWIALSLGMPAPQGSAVKDAPNLGCGLALFMLFAFCALFVAGIVRAWRWLRSEWESA